MNTLTKKITFTALLCALAYLCALLINIPVVFILEYEPKDVIITLGGLMFGPLAAVIVSVVVSLLEMVTISKTGPIGFLMNALASCAFSLPVAIMYKKKKSLFMLVLGLAIGCICMTTTMIFWNYLITPWYMGVARSVVVDMLVPVFLPFNALKSVLNATIILLIARQILSSMSRAKLIDTQPYMSTKAINISVICFSIASLIVCILAILYMQGVF